MLQGLLNLCLAKDLEYIYDSADPCPQDVITLSAGQKAVIKDAAGTSQRPKKCMLNFQSEEGFVFEIIRGNPFDCRILLKLITSPKPSADLIVSSGS